MAVCQSASSVAAQARIPSHGRQLEIEIDRKCFTCAVSLTGRLLVDLKMY
jgi:hypothetical protein